jgi:hypothetical protein
MIGNRLLTITTQIPYFDNEIFGFLKHVELVQQ